MVEERVQPVANCTERSCIKGTEEEIKERSRGREE